MYDKPKACPNGARLTATVCHFQHECVHAIVADMRFACQPTFGALTSCRTTGLFGQQLLQPQAASVIDGFFPSAPRYGTALLVVASAASLQQCVGTSCWKMKPYAVQFWSSMYHFYETVQKLSSCHRKEHYGAPSSTPFLPNHVGTCSCYGAVTHQFCV